ncbi:MULTISPECIES: hypothetical protein [Butyricimonas]|uniref:hypothetical protein n=1 Tax=Butyricimonas TaxID=574697 RepID=UPI001D07EB6C|nr:MULTISPECIES: hypothetical protein [Butyricimonas]MCB6971765.1 hypothetical protein [Butyricimonas synergistica]MCG4518627.1 hypothetical protein [Butyricimonas sp. DFI.6.44]
MKMMMKILLYNFVIISLFVACHDVPEGYLFVEDAGYLPDSMVVKVNLDTASVPGPNPIWESYVNEYYEYGYEMYPSLEEWKEFLNENGIYETILVKGEDYDRERLDIPWVSTAIQGVEGTNPIYVTITRVTTDTGDVDKMMKYLTVRNNGMFTIPCHHDIPIGRYKVSLNFKGPGYEANFDNIFTIVVK